MGVIHYDLDRDALLVEGYPLKDYLGLPEAMSPPAFWIDYCQEARFANGNWRITYGSSEEQKGSPVPQSLGTAHRFAQSFSAKKPGHIVRLVQIEKGDPHHDGTILSGYTQTLFLNGNLQYSATRWVGRRAASIR
jgi:hypothetical protein